MKKIFIALVIAACSISPALAHVDNDSPEIQQKIHDIQQNMRINLSEGRTDQARNILENASNNFHSVEIELGLIQTLMQAGEYRHALGAAAHTQAEHPDTVDTTLFYAWLLAIGGQTNPAITLLETTLERFPDNDVLLLMLKQIKIGQLISTDLNTSDAIQLKPFSSDKLRNINSKKYLTSGVIIGNGKKVITNLMSVENIKILSVRNGLGQIVSAQIEQKIPAAQIAILTLEKPLKTISTLTIADKPPFPGTPIYISGFSALNRNQADWPQLKTDILGTPTDGNNGYPVHVRTVAKGSGIYNQQGNLIGILADNDKAMLPLTHEIVAAYKKSVNNSVAKLSMDEIYEASLSNTVQVFEEY